MSWRKAVEIEGKPVPYWIPHSCSQVGCSQTMQVNNMYCRWKSQLHQIGCLCWQEKQHRLLNLYYIHGPEMETHPCNSGKEAVEEYRPLSVYNLHPERKRKGGKIRTIMKYLAMHHFQELPGTGADRSVSMWVRDKILKDSILLLTSSLDQYRTTHTKILGPPLARRSLSMEQPGLWCPILCF